MDGDFWGVRGRFIIRRLIETSTARKSRFVNLQVGRADGSTDPGGDSRRHDDIQGSRAKIEVRVTAPLRRQRQPGVTCARIKFQISNAQMLQTDVGLVRAGL